MTKPWDSWTSPHWVWKLGEGGLGGDHKHSKPAIQGHSHMSDHSKLILEERLCLSLCEEFLWPVLLPFTRYRRINLPFIPLVPLHFFSYLCTHVPYNQTVSSPFTKLINEDDPSTCGKPLPFIRAAELELYNRYFPRIHLKLFLKKIIPLKILTASTAFESHLNRDLWKFSLVSLQSESSTI